MFVYYVIKIRASFFRKKEKGSAGKRSLKVILSGIPSCPNRTQKGLNSSVLPSLEKVKKEIFSPQGLKPKNSNSKVFNM